MRWSTLLVLSLLAEFAPAQPLPNTQPLTATTDLARDMVDGLHRYLDRRLSEQPAERLKVWANSRDNEVSQRRTELKQLLGIQPIPPATELSYLCGPGRPEVLAILDGCKIRAVRWSVLPGIDAEGLFIESAIQPHRANVVALPHCEQTPEELAGLKPGDAFALKLARQGCNVLIPMLINRDDELSANPTLGRATNIPHREFIHRMAYELGRTMPGYEVQKILAAAQFFQLREPAKPLGLIGYGEGGYLALLAGAIEPRFQVVSVAGAFGSSVAIAERPLDRNLWGQLLKFGDAELARMIYPRVFLWDERAQPPEWAGPKPAKPGRSGAAPGRLPASLPEAQAEYQRYLKLIGGKVSIDMPEAEELKGGEQVDTRRFLAALLKNSLPTDMPPPAESLDRKPAWLPDAATRHDRQFRQLVDYTQQLWRDSEPVRKNLWAKVDASSPANWERTSEPLRKLFHEELIGQLTTARKALNPRTRKLDENDKWTSYEVVLDVYDDVIAYGIIAIPKNIKADEKRAVIVCQHGLEGRPIDIVHPKINSRFYNSFGAKLADLGYIVYAPQNPYIFQNHFRQVQRKANPLKLSLFSFITEQHRATLDWLESLPQVDSKRIGFYGLSYGGKTAMRVPPVEPRYRFSICSGDFNEWLGKNVTVDRGLSYMYTGEYEMFEFNLGQTFNYAEMANLIAPRPFMVERGHDDGVGVDEMIAYEFAKVRYLYANRLKIPHHAELEFQPGGHEIFLKGTLKFIQQHFGQP